MHSVKWYINCECNRTSLPRVRAYRCARTPPPFPQDSTSGKHGKKRRAHTHALLHLSDVSDKGKNNLSHIVTFTCTPTLFLSHILIHSNYFYTSRAFKIRYSCSNNAFALDTMRLMLIPVVQITCLATLKCDNNTRAQMV